MRRPGRDGRGDRAPRRRRPRLRRSPPGASGGGVRARGGGAGARRAPADPARRRRVRGPARRRGRRGRRAARAAAPAHADLCGRALDRARRSFADARGRRGRGPGRGRRPRRRAPPDHGARRARPGSARRRRPVRRGDRVGRREHRRRGRRPAVLDGRSRGSRRARSPRGQHARRDGRPPRAALRPLRHRGGARRRPRELAGRAAHRGADRPARRRPPRRTARLAPRRAGAPEPERGPRRGRVRGSARHPPRRHARVQRPDRAAPKARPRTRPRARGCPPGRPAGLEGQRRRRRDRDGARVTGAILIAGTTSDAGKSTVTAALCRWLRRRGVSVAPFKAQNMALNSTVTPGGAEIGRAQAMQAAACGIEPEAAMNPILIKPSGVAKSQVLVLGRPFADATARSYQELKAHLREPVEQALADLRGRFDVVVCEGAGSPAEINLRAGDLANMGLARAAELPVVLVGDIDRGGVFASLYGTVALLDAEDQALITGFLINKFRGDRSILEPGLEQLRELTGRPTFGVLPWLDGPFIDAEDSLALRGGATQAGTLDVAVIRLRWMSNFTDVDALAAEPGVSVRYTRSPADVERADLVVLPGTKATVEDLRGLREQGLDRALLARNGPILGICGGYQMLGERIQDEVESGAGVVDGLGLLPVRTTFAREKLLRRVRGEVWGVPAG